MATDVRLDDVDGSFVVVQGRVLKVVGSDLMLDSPERRRDNGSPNRRALVHDSQDGLTINFNGDYPGGVTISGNANFTGNLLLGGTALSATLDSIRSEVQGIKQSIDASVGRIDRLETTVASLVALMGASVIPPWKTQTDIEEGNNEVALGGDFAILSAEELGLVIDFKFDRQDPGFQHEDVVDITPPPGTAVMRGSTVTVTVNLEG